MFLNVSYLKVIRFTELSAELNMVRSCRGSTICSETRGQP